MLQQTLPRLGPDNNPSKWYILPIFAVFKRVEIPIFTVSFEHQPNIPENWDPQKKITFHVLQSTGYKKRFVATPNFTKYLYFIACLF